jgi:hypothetical protein
VPSLVSRSPGIDGTYAPTVAQHLCVAPPCATASTAPSGFNGLNPNGDWTLSALDASIRDTGGISGGWSLIIATKALAAVTPEPEPAPLALMVAGWVGLADARRRRR